MIDIKSIVKNTGLLYIRMIVSMVIGLIAVPIVLRCLGEVDFGIYNVVSGIVTMLAFLNNALSSTTQRFLSFELGRSNPDALQKVFSTSLFLYAIFCVIIVLLGETVGLWFVNSQLNIPSDRMYAANWIYQFSVASFVFSVLSAPYNAAIIAHEKMNIYAFVCIGESVIKLAMVISLIYVSGDRLILYGVFMMAVSALVLASYVLYCRKRIPECKLSFKFYNDIAQQLSGFAGWSVFGAVSNIFKNQGVNIILNNFFGVVVNTARGLAFQVDASANTLIQSFYLAVKPQLIKAYSSNETEGMFNLVKISTKIGYYLYFFISTILVIDTEFILSLWLGNIPEHTVVFTRLMLLSHVFTVLAQPLMIVIHATGKVSLYQFLSGITGILVLPVSYFLLTIYDSVLIPFLIIIVQNIVYWAITIERANSLAKLRITEYFRVCINLLITSMLIAIPTLLIFQMISGDWLRLLVLVLTLLLLSIIIIWMFGLNRQEKDYISLLFRNSKFTLRDS